MFLGETQIRKRATPFWWTESLLSSAGPARSPPLWSWLNRFVEPNARIKPLGFLATGSFKWTTQKDANAFRDITKGSNGAFSAGPGWDPTTGLGSPSGMNLDRALSAASEIWVRAISEMARFNVQPYK